MTLIYVAFVSMFLCISCLNEHHWSSSNGIERNKLKFTDLNSDVLYLIFSQSNLEDVLNTDEAFPELHNLIHEMLQRKYLNYELQLKLPLVNRFIGFRRHFKAYDVFPKENRFVAYDNRNFDLNVFKVFGDVFQTIKLTFCNNIEVKRWKLVSKILNEYCSRTVKRLELNDIDESILNQFTLPFESVEKLTFSVNCNNLNVQKTLNELFPNLQSFELQLSYDLNYSFIDCELPKLEHLKMTVTRESWQKRDQIEGLIRKNPNIQSIELVGYIFPSNYIEVINQFLPNLQHFTLTWMNIEIDAIHFENLKSLDIIQIENESTIEKLWLTNLKSLRFFYDPKFFDAWQQFFQRHTNISYLRFQQTFTRSVGNILINSLLDSLTNLIDVNFECIFDISIENITSFVENHQHLQKFRFSFKGFTDNDESFMRTRFENEWIIENIDRNYDNHIFKGLSFERI